MTTIEMKLINKKDSGLGIRHLQIFLLFMCCSLSYFIRINTSVAVVAMTNKNTTNPDFEEFPWKEQEKNLILSSFFWGYVITQLPAGWLAERYGARYLLLSSVLVPAMLSLITPMCVHYGGWEAFCAIRIVQGIFQGFIFPCINTFLAKWSPVNERNRLGAFSYSGIEFGTVLAFCASGFIASSPMGWPGISYVSGGLGLIWCVIWFYFGSNNPDESKLISLNEKKYIEASLHQSYSKIEKELTTPWLDIFTSVPFWALLITGMCQTWGFIILLTQIPTYMNSILKLDIKSNSILSAIPYVVMLIVSYLFILIADTLSKKNISLVWIRKSFNTIAFWISAITIVGLGFVTSDQLPLAIILLSLNVGTSGLHTLGSVMNHIDLSSNHVGVLMGISNTLGNCISIIAPLVNSKIVNDEKNQLEWRVMFGITAGLFFIGNLVYLIFGKVEEQPWNNKKFKHKDIEKMATIPRADNNVHCIQYVN